MFGTKTAELLKNEAAVRRFPELREQVFKNKNTHNEKERRVMHIEPSDQFSWAPGPVGHPLDDGQQPLFESWCEDELHEISTAPGDPTRLDVRQAEVLFEKMKSDHPGIEVSLRVGGVDDHQSVGFFKKATLEIVLSDAVEDLEAVAAAGYKNICYDQLGMHNPETIAYLFTKVLVFATYDQGRPHGVERYGPEFIGTYAYVMDRYVAGFEEGAIIWSALNWGLRVRVFLPWDWQWNTNDPALDPAAVTIT